jgi:hypothetical protein
MSVLPFPIRTVIAAAIAAPLTIDLEVQGRATAEHEGTVTLYGVVTCSAETVVTLDGEVVESLGRNAVAAGTFATELPCGHTPTPWRVTVPSDRGTPFKPGFATADVRAVGFDSGSGTYSSVQSLVSLHLTRSAR